MECNDESHISNTLTRYKHWPNSRCEIKLFPVHRAVIMSVYVGIFDGSTKNHLSF